MKKLPQFSLKELTKLILSIHERTSLGSHIKTMIGNFKKSFTSVIELRQIIAHTISSNDKKYYLLPKLH